MEIEIRESIWFGLRERTVEETEGDQINTSLTGDYIIYVIYRSEEIHSEEIYLDGSNIDLILDMTPEDPQPIEIEIYDSDGRSMKEYDVVERNMEIILYEPRWFGLREETIEETEGAHLEAWLDEGEYNIRVEWKGSVAFDERQNLREGSNVIHLDSIPARQIEDWSRETISSSSDLKDISSTHYDVQFGLREDNDKMRIRLDQDTNIDIIPRIDWDDGSQTTFKFVNDIPGEETEWTDETLFWETAYHYSAHNSERIGESMVALTWVYGYFSTSHGYFENVLAGAMTGAIAGAIGGAKLGGVGAPLGALAGGTAGSVGMAMYQAIEPEVARVNAPGGVSAITMIMTPRWASINSIMVDNTDTGGEMSLGTGVAPRVTTENNLWDFNTYGDPVQDISFGTTRLHEEVDEDELYDYDEDNIIWDRGLHESRVTDLKIDPHRGYLLSSSVGDPAIYSGYNEDDNTVEFQHTGGTEDATLDIDSIAVISENTHLFGGDAGVMAESGHVMEYDIEKDERSTIHAETSYQDHACTITNLEYQGGVIYSSGTNSKVVAWDYYEEEVLWKYDSTDGTDSSAYTRKDFAGPVDGYLYTLNTEDDTIRAHDVNDGSIIWSTTLQGSPRSIKYCYEDDLIYSYGYDGMLLVVDPETTDTVLSHDLSPDDDIIEDITIDNDNDLLYAGSRSDELIAFDLDEEVERWRWNKYESVLSLLYDDGKLYIGLGDGEIEAYQTGAVLTEDIKIFTDEISGDMSRLLNQEIPIYQPGVGGSVTVDESYHLIAIDVRDLPDVALSLGWMTPNIHIYQSRVHVESPEGGWSETVYLLGTDDPGGFEGVTLTLHEPDKFLFRDIGDYRAWTGPGDWSRTEEWTPLYFNESKVHIPGPEDWEYSFFDELAFEWGSMREEWGALFYMIIFGGLILVGILLLLIFAPWLLVSILKVFGFVGRQVRRGLSRVAGSFRDGDRGKNGGW